MGRVQEFIRYSQIANEGGLADVPALDKPTGVARPFEYPPGGASRASGALRRDAPIHASRVARAAPGAQRARPRPNLSPSRIARELVFAIFRRMSALQTAAAMARHELIAEVHIECDVLQIGYPSNQCWSTPDAWTAPAGSATGAGPLKRPQSEQVGGAVRLRCVGRRDVLRANSSKAVFRLYCF